VLPPDTSGADAVEGAERLRAAIAAHPIPQPHVTITVSASIGVAWCPVHADSGDGLLRVADQAMYQAKRAGRNRTHSPTDLQAFPERA
jgi:diguanylate cyclase (GGDEF)-like protein